MEAEDEYAILYDWLSELLFLHDSEYMVFSKFEVKIDCKIEERQKKYILEASVYGEEFDPRRHERRSEVKAVTYHMMDIKAGNPIHDTGYSRHLELIFLGDDSNN